MEYIGKKGGWISRIDSPDVVNNTIFLCLKMIEKLENQEFTRKDVLTDLMKEMLRVTC